jgi:hypothetical protein
MNYRIESDGDGWWRLVDPALGVTAEYGSVSLEHLTMEEVTIMVDLLRQRDCPSSRGKRTRMDPLCRTGERVLRPQEASRPEPSGRRVLREIQRDRGLAELGQPTAPKPQPAKRAVAVERFSSVRDLSHRRGRRNTREGSHACVMPAWRVR